jgi:hypothetical protein
MNVSFQRLRIVESTDKDHLIFKRLQRLKHFPQFHRFAFPFGPPFPRMVTTSRKQNGHSSWRFARGPMITTLISPDPDGLHPGQGHRNPKASQQRSARHLIALHGQFSVSSTGDEDDVCKLFRGRVPPANLSKLGAQYDQFDRFIPSTSVGLKLGRHPIE